MVETQIAESKLKGERSLDHAALVQSGSGYVLDTSGASLPRLLGRYGLQSSGRAEDRMLLALGAIDAALNTKDPLSSLVTHDTRREVFHLEALLRLYAPEHPELEGALGKVKQLEDALGTATTVQNALLKAQAKDAPVAVLDTLTAGFHEAQNAVMNLVADAWLPGKDGLSAAVASIAKTLGKTDFGGPEHDRKFLKKALAGQIEKIRDEHYSMKVLADGVHALRRQLRWAALYMEALHGAVQLAPVKHEDSGYVKILSEPETKKQIQMQDFPAAVVGEKPLMIPAELYAGLQKSIYDLGNIKDDVEQRDLLGDAYKSAGVPRHRLEDLIGNDAGTLDDMTKRATRVHDTMKQEHLLKRLQHAFEDA